MVQIDESKAGIRKYNVGLSLWKIYANYFGTEKSGAKSFETLIKDISNIQYKRKFTCTKLLAKDLQLACERQAEGEASEAKQAFKRLVSCLQKVCKPRLTSLRLGKACEKFGKACDLYCFLHKATSS